jgi:nicotinate-nucleotide pyrophosphorylase
MMVQTSAVAHEPDPKDKRKRTPEEIVRHLQARIVKVQAFTPGPRPCTPGMRPFSEVQVLCGGGNPHRYATARASP